MAENEFLDLGKSRRWQRVLRAVLEGRPVDEAATLAELCLRQTINRIRKTCGDDRPPQVPLGDFLDAWDRDPRDVERMVRKSGGNDYAQLFRDATLMARSRETAVHCFLLGICEKFFDQIQVRALRADSRNTCRGVRSTLDQIQEHMGPEISSIAQRLSQSPEGPLRRSKKQAAGGVAPLLGTQSILNESLLGLEQ